ncbi:MAG: hypothetical protein ABS939_08395 [Psychrobacillus sp.]
MREETIKIYKFNELNPEAQKRAIQEYRDSIDWDCESEIISEGFKIKLNELGLPIDDLEWRLSHSQGDGVAFYGDVDMSVISRRLLDGENLSLYELIESEGFMISASIYRNSFGHHYSHWNTMSVEMNGDSADVITIHLYDLDEDDEQWDEKLAKIESLILELEEKISNDIKEVSRELEKNGYEMISYIESDNAIEEAIEANDYEYTEDGSIF